MVCMRFRSFSVCAMLAHVTYCFFFASEISASFFLPNCIRLWNLGHCWYQMGFPNLDSQHVSWHWSLTHVLERRWKNHGA